jgi:hypothetical protein
VPDVTARANKAKNAGTLLSPLDETPDLNMSLGWKGSLGNLQTNLKRRLKRASKGGGV